MHKDTVRVPYCLDTFRKSGIIRGVSETGIFRKKAGICSGMKTFAGCKCITGGSIILNRK